MMKNNQTDFKNFKENLKKEYQIKENSLLYKFYTICTIVGSSSFFSLVLGVLFLNINFALFGLCAFFVLSVVVIHFSMIVFNNFERKYKERLYNELPVISAQEFESLLSSNELKVYYPIGCVLETVKGDVCQINMVINPENNPEYKSKIGVVLNGGDYFESFKKEASKDNG